MIHDESMLVRVAFSCSLRCPMSGRRWYRIYLPSIWSHNQNISCVGRRQVFGNRPSKTFNMYWSSCILFRLQEVESEAEGRCCISHSLDLQLEHLGMSSPALRSFTAQRSLAPLSMYLRGSRTVPQRARSHPQRQQCFSSYRKR